MKHPWRIGLLCLLILLLAMSPYGTWLTGTAGADTKRIEGTTNVEDATIQDWAGNSDKNYGGRITIQAGLNFHALIRVKNVASELGVGATDITAVCSVYCEVVTAVQDVSAHQVLKPWVEGDEVGVDDDDGDVTWNDWASDEYEWTTAGCDCANDDGVDNSADDGACDDPSRRDRKVTAEDTESGVTTGNWYGFDISASLAEGWYAGTKNEEGIVLISNANNQTFTSTEGASNQPFFVFTYTTDGEPAGNPRLHRKKRMGGIDEENTHLARLACPDWLQ